MKLGERIAEKRKEQGLTQAELAEQMLVTRQTVSRWEAGAALPDIEKIAQLARLLDVSCDYLLMDADCQQSSGNETKTPGVSRLLQNVVGKTVKFNFYDEEVDTDVATNPCYVLGFEGNWMEVEILRKKETMRKLLAVSTIVSIEMIEEEA